ncbi:MAG: alpha/beta fold hydrolase [Spartobacteria bacterium]|nr:alpha/beta fold hydrolase [Spartobacteria bacterium]
MKKLMRPRMEHSLPDETNGSQSMPSRAVTFFMAALLASLCFAPSLRADNYALVSNAVNEARLELEASLSNSVPSLNLILQTSNETYFVSSSAAPELALTTGTTFRFASNTKNFTSTAILLLQQMGLLNITNRIVDMIPGADQPFIPDGANWAIPNKEIITIEQLLRHSAGVYDVDNDEVPGCGGMSFTQWMIEQDPAHQFTVEEMVGQAALHQLSYFVPDEGYHYSNTGYTMLAEIVGRVYSHYMGAIKTLSDFLYEMNIVGPDIRFPNLATDTALPEPYMWGTERQPSNITVLVSNCNMSAQVGEGNGYGTLPALNRHIRSTMKGEGVLSNAMIRLMQTDTSPHNANYALGCFVTPDIGFGHNGSRVGNLSFMAYNPDTDVSVAVYLPLVDFSDLMDSFMLCYRGMYSAAYRALEALGYPRTPTLQEGAPTNINLVAHQTNAFFFTAVKDVYYGVMVSNATADIQLALSPAVDSTASRLFTNHLGWTCPAPGAYRLDISSDANTPACVRLYTLTNTIARVSALITNLMADFDLVGLGFSMVDGDYVVMADGFGLADRERSIPADENTVFMIGSCSKTFGAVAAMQLVEEGLLDLDTSITNALPGFTIHQRFADNIITPRTILTHHSGLPGDLFNLGFTVRPVPGALDAIQQLISEEYTLMPTNTFWAYNNSGFVLLNQMFRHLTGQPIDVFARERLFDRMGMTNSSMAYDLPHIKEALACPYMDGALVPYEYVNLGFAGAIYSTAGDMTRYMRMLLADGMGEESRVLPEDRLASMFVKQNTDIPLDQFTTILNMGIGFMLDPPWMQYMGKVVWHDGATDFYRSMVRVAVDAGIGCFISCNTAEAEAINPEIIDAALKWAYEEKTGIAPPPPVEPGTPNVTNAPADVIALATNGIFVTGAGYDYFTANETGIVAHINAHSDAPHVARLVYRENGWFTLPATNTPQFLFTQVVGRIVYVLKNFAYGVTNLALIGEQSDDLTPVDPAWNDRIGRWWATNLHPADISWHGDDVIESEITLDLTMRDSMLLAQDEYVMGATNDSIAFAAGLGRNKGSALLARPDGSLCFLGVHYRSAESIPVLQPGAQTNGVIVSNETHWLRIDATAGQPLTIDLETEAELTAYLYDTNGSHLGQANRAHTFHLDASDARPVMAAILRNGDAVGAWTLAAHTNAIPFYVQVPPGAWPDTLALHSNLFPNTDFGYVFVHANRTNQAGSALKIAVARMNAPAPGAPPLFFCNGGPGDSSIRCVYQYYEKLFADEYDVYLIDQRGLGYSLPDLSFRGDDESPVEAQYRVGMLSGLDLSAINTLESSYDLEDIAQVHGLTNVNLHGVSYGTLLAQTLMRREPPWLRAVVLDGDVAPNIPALNEGGPVMKEALDALFADVDASAAPYPTLYADFYALGNHLQANPVELKLPDRTNTVDGVAFVSAALAQLTASDLSTRERIPGIVWRAWRGETAALAELYTQWNVDTNNMIRNSESELMGHMVFRYDFLPFNSLEGLSNACAPLPEPLRTYALQYDGDIIRAASALADAGQAGPDFALPVTSAIPTLVINGAFDTQTGTNWAAEVASHLPNSYLVIVPTVGHGVLAGGDCSRGIVRAFLNDPTQAPDTSCLADLTLDYPPPWPSNTIPLAAGEGATNTFTQTGQGAWYAIEAEAGAWYALHVGALDGRQTLRLVDTNAAIAAVATNSILRWRCERSDTYYVWLVGRTEDTFVVRYTTGPHPGGAIDDFDGDGLTDVAVYWPEGGNWYLDYSAGGDAAPNWGWNAVMPAPADYDGDGCCDLSVYHPATGDWYLRYSSGGSQAINWGWEATVPVPGDYDGDGRADVTVYYPDGGAWYILESGSGVLRRENWGWSGALPVPADYDGDGLCDPGVYWPEQGQWYLLLSGSGEMEQLHWGWSDTAPVPADYDGDGRADVAVYWAEQGTWFILNSSGGGQSRQWGWTGVIPLPGDYDGDGQADVTVYDQANGIWYIRRTSDGQLEQRDWGWNAAYGVWPQMWVNGLTIP